MCTAFLRELWLLRSWVSHPARPGTVCKENDICILTACIWERLQAYAYYTRKTSKIFELVFLDGPSWLDVMPHFIISPFTSVLYSAERLHTNGFALI